MKAACGINCPDYALINKGASVGESPFMQDTLIPTFRSATQPQHLRHPPCATLPLNKKKPHFCFILLLFGIIIIISLCAKRMC